MRSFLKCGISIKLDKEEDHLINIHSLEGYEMPEPEREFHLQSDKENDGESEISYDEGDASDDFGDSSSFDSSSDERKLVVNVFIKKLVKFTLTFYNCFLPTHKPLRV